MNIEYSRFLLDGNEVFISSASPLIKDFVISYKGRVLSNVSGIVLHFDTDSFLAVSLGGD